ncbi:MAG: 2-C-methyl-D-erythritol 2,4-cyclodiphosphate synthase [Treponemataceae bacterium]|nr:2-C-methyl-D-erythritol 2,4-cyclodiphosphate synthase [Treponemataceae bacterium]
MMTEMRNKAALVLTAAGSSTRIGTGIKKEFLPLGKGSVLSEACSIFIRTLGKKLSIIVITYPADKRTQTEEAFFSDPDIRRLLEKHSIKLIFTEGGGTRQESVRKALEALAETESGEQTGFVLIHDAARPWVNTEIIEDVCKAAEQYGAAVPAVPATDTLAATESLDGGKGLDGQEKIIRSYLDRKSIFCLQTPQCFDFQKLLAAHRAAAGENRNDCTDDTTVWTAYYGPVHLSKGSTANKKITFATDIPGGTTMKIRTGLGYDLHRLTEGRKLIIGGVDIPFEKGEDGHSDGDVLLHAITDALLGAAGLGDIGELFPPSDDRWKGADSRKLLKEAWQKVKDEGWKLENIDCVIALERPKFLPYRLQVRESIASVLECPAESVFVKAKTGEKIGKIGRGEAVEAWVTCLISHL